jgi:hypothetical protein
VTPPDYVFKAPGLLIEAWRFASGEELPFIGLLVEFDAMIAKESRGMALESAMRYWQRNVGSVRRGGRADLAGWRVYVFKDCRIARVRLSFPEEEEKHEADG